jgi:hypothetical protein
MAKRAKVVRKPAKSVLTKEQLYLDRHDEEKVLLFTTGLLLGVGIAVSILQNIFWYGWLSAVVIVLVLMFIESRQK